MDELPASQRSVRVCRAIEYGDISFVHNTFTLDQVSIHRLPDAADRLAVAKAGPALQPRSIQTYKALTIHAARGRFQLAALGKPDTIKTLKN